MASYIWDEKVSESVINRAKSSDPHGMGEGLVWPFGGENWCNLQGKYIHLVADMSGESGTMFRTGICSLGVFGTEYDRTTAVATTASIN